MSDRSFRLHVSADERDIRQVRIHIRTRERPTLVDNTAVSVALDAAHPWRIPFMYRFDNLCQCA